MGYYILYHHLYTLLILIYVYTFIWPLDTKSNECMYLFSLKTVCYDDIAKAIFSFVYVTKNAWKDVGYGTGSSLESWPNLRWLDSIQLFSRVTRLWISWPKGKKLWPNKIQNFRLDPAPLVSGLVHFFWTKCISSQTRAQHYKVFFSFFRDLKWDPLYPL